MNLTEDQILTLAPDEPSKKSGKELANPAKWVSKGKSEMALWGEAQGSGSKPYQTQIDTSNIACKCSCPSRKFPCKHGLGLLLLYARQPALFTAAEMPAWVSDWISKRTQREEKKAEKGDKPVDEAAQVKRQDNREKKVADGTTELLLWIKDIVRNGILTMPEKGAAFWEQTAKRMVDAQAPGLAGMVSNLGQVNFFAEGWQTEFMDRLIPIFLLISGYQNKDELPALLKQDIRNGIGFTQNQDELKEQTGVTDNWLVLAKQTSEEDNLTIERCWLHGLTTGRYALLLQFLFRGQGAEWSLTPGMYLQAELVYYPSIAPLRAILKRQITTNAAFPTTMYAHWKEVSDRETQIQVALPFSTEWPYVIQQVIPVFYLAQWWLADGQNNLVQIKQGFKNIWTLLALSAGSPIAVAVVGKENIYEPVGIWMGETYKSL